MNKRQKRQLVTSSNSGTTMKRGMHYFADKSHSGDVVKHYVTSFKNNLKEHIKLVQ